MLPLQMLYFEDLSVGRKIGHVGWETIGTESP
jgi:acyl dehydratase